jgi:DNA modification methylase
MQLYPRDNVWWTKFKHRGQLRRLFDIDKTRGCRIFFDGHRRKSREIVGPEKSRGHRSGAQSQGWGVVSARILVGDCREVLARLPSESAQCVVTSPPYWGLRDYGVDGQLGMEETVDEYVAAIVAVFAEVRRVLRADGTVWLNLGDTYIGARGGGQGKNSAFASRTVCLNGVRERSADRTSPGLKPKDLALVPARCAIALQADGWWLRSDIIWNKPNPMPESVTDRPTKSHEHLFLLSKSEVYYYDQAAIMEPATGRDPGNSPDNKHEGAFRAGDERMRTRSNLSKVGARAHRNKRDVWTVATQPFRGAHFATFPPNLIEPCVLAGAPLGGVVLDPFTGAGTTALVSSRCGRRFLGVEINPAYAEMARQRIVDDAPLINAVEVA